jgi:hypothetical protein
MSSLSLSSKLYQAGRSLFLVRWQNKYVRARVAHAQHTHTHSGGAESKKRRPTTRGKREAFVEKLPATGGRALYGVSECVRARERAGG